MGFAAKKYQQAVDYYTQALEVSPNNEILLCNRAFAHLRMESYGAAVADATAAMEVNPKFIKVRCARRYCMGADGCVVGGPRWDGMLTSLVCVCGGGG